MNAILPAVLLGLFSSPAGADGGRGERSPEAAPSEPRLRTGPSESPLVVDSSATAFEKLRCSCSDLRGAVYLYGKRLQPPYVFEIGEADTVLLNGVPYEPPRRRAERDREMKAQLEASRGEAYARHEWHRQHADEVSAALRENASPSTSDRLDAWEAALRADPQVEYVRRSESAVDYKVRGTSYEMSIEFSDSPILESLRGASVPDPRQRLESCHESLCRSVCGGRVVVRGDGYWEIISVGSRTAFLEAMEVTRQTGVPPPEALGLSRLFANDQFISDLANEEEVESHLPPSEGK